MPRNTAGWYDAEPAPRKSPVIALRSKLSTTSTTNRARCCPGSHSFTEGGSRNPVSRSTSRKLLIPPLPLVHQPPSHTTLWGQTAPKSDRLLGSPYSDVL